MFSVLITIQIFVLLLADMPLVRYWCVNHDWCASRVEERGIALLCVKLDFFPRTEQNRTNKCIYRIYRELGLVIK